MLCSQLISQLQNIQGQYQELNQKIDGFVELKNAKASTEAKSVYLLSLFQSRKELRKLIKELQREFFNPTIETKNYITVEGQPTQETEIKIDFEAILNKAKTFYQKHEINLPPDFEVRAKKIWTKNYKIIQKEIATYGYDHVLIIPDNLPPLSELHNRMTAGYSPSYQNVTFKNNGSFSKAKNSKKKDNLFRLVLSHNVQNLEDNLLLKATKGKSPQFLLGKNMTDIISGTSKDDIEAIIARKGKLPIAIKFKNINLVLIN